MLSEAIALNIEGIVNKEDIERQRNHLLNTQYNADMVEISTYRYLSANDISDFIEFTVNDIAKTILRWFKRGESACHRRRRRFGVNSCRNIIRGKALKSAQNKRVWKFTERNGFPLGTRCLKKFENRV